MISLKYIKMILLDYIKMICLKYIKKMCLDYIKIHLKYVKMMLKLQNFSKLGFDYSY